MRVKKYFKEYWVTIVLILVPLGLGAVGIILSIGEYVVYAAFVLATIELGRKSKLIKLELERERRSRLDKLLDAAKKIRKTETESIVYTLSIGKEPQPQYNILDDLRRNLDRSDDATFRKLVLDAFEKMETCIDDENQRPANAKIAEALYLEVKNEIKEMKRNWHREYMGLS